MMVRHGKAVEAADAGGDDYARTLTGEGRKRIRQAARAMARLGLAPQTIWTSPFPRAQETAALIAKALDCDDRLRADDRLSPGAPPEAFLGLAAMSGEEADVMFVGHNPDLEDLLTLLLDVAGPDHFPLKKGTLAIVRLDPGWPENPRGRGRLEAFWTAGDLCRLA